MLKDSMSYLVLKGAIEIVPNAPNRIPREVLEACDLMLGNFSSLAEGDSPDEVSLSIMFNSLGVAASVLASTRDSLISDASVYLQTDTSSKQMWGETISNSCANIKKPQYCQYSRIRLSSIHKLRLAKNVEKEDEFIFI